MRHSILSAFLLCAGLPSASSAQVAFDYITFDSIRLDPNFALLTSTRWGILVNTGTVPISLDDDWERGLYYAESSDQLGGFFYELLNPFQNDLVLQPGEAIGDADPLLLAELLPGETFVSNALIATFQFGVPFPSSDFHVDVLAQIGDRIAKTRTDVEIADLGGTDFWVPVSAKRVSCELSPVSWQSYGSSCGTVGGAGLDLYPRGHNGGPGGPPWVAFRSNMPQLGNWAFGMELNSPAFQPSYVLGFDVAPGSFPLAGCELLLGFTPALTVLQGSIPFFQETHNVPIPNNPNLTGLSVYFQAALMQAPPLVSNGVVVVLGDVTP